MLVTKQQVIAHGLEFLRGVGTEAICEVCIPNGGSCCKGCRFLKEREGCQARNTGCTAWLCGFQQYLLFQIGILDTWKNFWDQIPGQDYRQDFTPETISIKEWMSNPDTRLVSNALASDLQVLIDLKKINISSFNDTLLKYMEQLSVYQDTDILWHVLKKIKAHMKDCKHVSVQLENYFNR